MTSLGRLQRLRIGHDGVGHGAGWHLDKVTVREHGSADASKEFVFPCNRWLDDHEDDRRTERELIVAGNDSFVVYSPQRASFFAALNLSDGFRQMSASKSLQRLMDLGKTTESVHCTITGPCLRMRRRPSARTLQHVTVPIGNIYLDLYHCARRLREKYIVGE